MGGSEFGHLVRPEPAATPGEYALLEGLGFIACVLDSAGRLLALNGEAGRALAWPIDEAAGQPLEALTALAPGVLADIRQALGDAPAALRFEGPATLRESDRSWIAWDLRPLPGTGRRWLLTGQDRTPERRLESAQRLNESRLEALLTLNQMTSASLAEITDFALEEAVRLTSSTVGFLAFANDDESVLTMHAWSHSAMEQCRVAEWPVVFPVDQTGLWGEPLRQRRPVVTNNYAAANPLKHGTPAGHVPINRHLGIPVFQGEQVVAVAGVSNKATDYDESDIRQLRLLMSGMWQLVRRRRAEDHLRARHDLLEQRFRQRTAELQEVNQALAEEMKEHERAEVGMAEAEDRYRSLFDLSPDGILLFDPETELPLEFNEAACRQLGYQPEELRRLRIRDIQAAVPPARVRERIRQALTEGRLDFDSRHRAKSGELREVHVTVQPLTIAGETLLHVIFRDITDRKRAEAERQRAEELERRLRRTSALHALGQLTAGIAHDFRNLLTAVGALAAAIQEAGPREDVVRECSDGIVEAVEQGAGLVRQLLGFSRHEPGQLEPVDLNQVVGAVDRLVRKTLGGQIRVDLDLAPTLPSVAADPVQVQQVLLNLAVNARDAMPDGGSLRISTRTVSAAQAGAVIAGAPPAEQYVALSVVDTGTGIPDEVVARIFDPHFSTKQNGDSVGLGLATVQDIAHRHHGHVLVESQVGLGSTFTVLFPVCPAEP